MPQTLVDILNEYKIWWSEQKALHGDLWVNSDFCLCKIMDNLLTLAL